MSSKRKHRGKNGRNEEASKATPPAAPGETAPQAGPSDAAGDVRAPGTESSQYDDAPARTEDIRGVLLQVSGARLLLPNAVIAEVLSYADPEPIENAPEWLLGRIRWRGWQLPLVAFSRLTGLAQEQGSLGTKVLVLRALNGNPKLPFFALLTQGFPRLVTVSRSGLSLVEDGQALPVAVHGQVRLNEDDALLPDLAQLEQLIGDAVAAAA